MSITREQLQDLLRHGAQLVEVLPPEEFAEEHIPGAINIPLTELTAERAREELDPARAIVTYCQDWL